MSARKGGGGGFGALGFDKSPNKLAPGVLKHQEHDGVIRNWYRRVVIARTQLAVWLF